MKNKKVVIFIILIILIILAIGVYIWNNVPRVDAKNVDLNKVKDYIISLSNGYGREDFKTFVEIEELKREVKGDKIILYVFAITKSCIEREDIVETSSHGVSLYKFTIKDNDIKDYDLALTSADEKKIFPKDVIDICNKVDSKKLEESLEEQVVNYYGEEKINYTYEGENMIPQI